MGEGIATQHEIGAGGEVCLPEDRRKRDYWHRAVMVEVGLPGGDASVEVACIHLDHVKEPTRLQQLGMVLSMSARTGGATIITGDFNALTEADYTSAEWAEVGRIRESN